MLGSVIVTASCSESVFQSEYPSQKFNVRSLPSFIVTQVHINQHDNLFLGHTVHILPSILLIFILFLRSDQMYIYSRRMNKSSLYKYIINLISQSLAFGFRERPLLKNAVFVQNILFILNLHDILPLYFFFLTLSYLNIRPNINII